MSLNSFIKREIKLGSKLIKKPQTSYELKIRWEYTSSAGRNHYSRYSDFPITYIRRVYNELNIAERYKETKSNVKPESTRVDPKNQSNDKGYTNDDIEDIGE